MVFRKIAIYLAQADSEPEEGACKQRQEGEDGGGGGGGEEDHVQGHHPGYGRQGSGIRGCANYVYNCLRISSHTIYSGFLLI